MATVTFGSAVVAVGSADTLIHTPRSSSQVVPSVTALAGGGWVVTWRDDRNGNGDIYQRAYNAQGVAIGTEDTLVHSPQSSNQDWPSVAALAGGGWVVTWGDQRNGNYDIYQRVYDASGTAIGTQDTLVHTAQSSSQHGPSVAALPGGGWVVTWQDDRNGNGDIYQRAYNAQGVAIGTQETLVHTPQSSNQNTPSVAALAGGGWVVTWGDQRNGNYDIYQRVYDASGTAIGTQDTLVHTAQGSHQGLSSVAALPGGGWVVTWEDNRNGNYDIYQRVFRPQASGTEDVPLTLPVTVTPDSGETVTRLVLDLPTGWAVTGAPAGSTITHNGGGTWTVQGGTLSGTVNLTLTSLTNANGQHHVSVTPYSQVGAGAERAGGQAVTLVNLAAVNDAPTAVALSGAGVPEFSAAGTVVGQLSTTDPDGDSAFSYTLLDNAGGRFALVGNEVRVANGILLDFEQAASHTIQVRATDAGGLSRTETLTVAVRNVDPEVVTGTGAADTIVGGALDDRFTGTGGDDALNGAAGADTAVYAGSVSSYSWSRNQDGTFRIADSIAGRDGADTLSGIEFLRFADGYASLLTTATGWMSNVYDGQNRQDYARIVNNDGTSTYVDYDQTSSYGWSEVTQSFDAQGRLDTNGIRNDDGSFLSIDYDQANANPWSRIEQTITATGQVDTNWAYYDDGSAVYTDFDQAGAFNWSRIEQSFDAQGRLDTSRTVFDDGTAFLIDYDQAGAFNWSQIERAYDAQGRLDTETVRNDDNTWTYIDYDQTNAFSWTRIEQNFDAGGRLARAGSATTMARRCTPITTRPTSLVGRASSRPTTPRGGSTARRRAMTTAGWCTRTSTRRMPTAGRRSIRPSTPWANSCAQPCRTTTEACSSPDPERNAIEVTLPSPELGRAAQVTKAQK